MRKQKVFISSVQSEFTHERILLAEYFRKDALMKLFFEPFIFEEVPANTKSPGKVFFSEVKKSDIYIGLLGSKYGFEDAEGISPTEREYDKAKEENIQRWIFLKEMPFEKRHPKEQKFVLKIEQDVSRKVFRGLDDLISELYKSCILFLQQNGFIETTDFDNGIHRVAQINDLDLELINDFVTVAREKRNFPLKNTDSTDKILTSLKLLRAGKIVNSSLLLFNRNPQYFFPSANIKCAHFHGITIQKPIPDYKVFGGTVFNMADSAVDFILSKISLSTGSREYSNRVDTEYEIPRRVIAEAVINAIAHKNYYSNSSIQVSVFKDRVEIANPGSLPPELELEDLKRPHNSYPHNPILADCLFLTGEIERYGTGTIEMYDLSLKQQLPEPSFSLNEGFKVTLWRPSSKFNSSTDYDTVHVADYVTDQDTDYEENLIKRIILALNGEMNRQEIMLRLDLKHVPNFRENYLSPSEKLGLLEMTLPDKPTSRKQKYRLTETGKKLQKQLKLSGSNS